MTFVFTKKPPRPDEQVDQHATFKEVCHDMYKRFGAVAAKLTDVVQTPEEQTFVVQELHKLRAVVRELLNQAHAMKKEE